ncbi:hydroxylamine reductase [Methanosarcina thermophila]|jgi:hydroxylamine reductase|uniref:Hydroxylamine reductase n=3 Tax=Methanosarcina thermophila TaxID=2210 RepID=A0A1I6ZSW8_METTE|nr:hydroxylamine reductase [Methanosarcina thermophila]ALK06022.1 MAG: hydroxylamine reductase [Methanosarcina sp. 795]AKB12396.1 Hydroxylamine reductase [Methanosarcina thermophila TM-1]AKB14400.1 Hydroxylamine reductase [Methanosarcina thermophila CHTI-55]NLU58080.1 hydroxylamine reductase [Methanosarcina thermophila]SFT65711.1 hydroxylamine reductase [Methanosarcina thermophila]
MFCNQCQEALNVKGCTKNGVCGKKGEVADLQDRLIYVLKSISFYNLKARAAGVNEEATDRFVLDSYFATLTNTNFDKQEFESLINKGFKLRDEIKGKLPAEALAAEKSLPAVATVTPENIGSLDVAVHSTQDEDIRSLREILTFGLKGLAAYAHHAYVLGYKDEGIYEFIEKGLVSTTDDSLDMETLLGMVLECGKKGVSVLALLDKANTETYGNPEPTAVNIGVRDRPGILISGHDLRDLEQLLEQTKGTGIDVYTHGEMLPANAYPAFKKYDNFVGNYGNSWWKQYEEFEKFNGPILMTTNCIIPPRESYKNRIYTTGVVGFEGLTHIYEKEDGTKDFSPLIEQAKTSKPPEPIESGTITAGFAHEAALSVADKIIDAVKSGKISRFIVMAGCDGRHKERAYYTDFAKALPKDTVILTAGCAKYRYNKLDLGDIEGIPRVIDAGQCNDSYSLVVIAQKLAEVFGLENINDLPVSYNIAWYEQKAVLVLLALLSLGIKNITLGPTLPAFLSPNVVKVLVENFNLRPNTTVEEDMKVLLKQA